jgi:hypothetical protein
VPTSRPSTPSGTAKFNCGPPAAEATARRTPVSGAATATPVIAANCARKACATPPSGTNSTFSSFDVGVLVVASAVSVQLADPWIVHGSGPNGSMTRYLQWTRSDVPRSKSVVLVLLWYASCRRMRFVLA